MFAGEGALLLGLLGKCSLNVYSTLHPVCCTHVFVMKTVHLLSNYVRDCLEDKKTFKLKGTNFIFTCLYNDTSVSVHMFA